MPAPFAALQDRVNNAVFARLANAQAVLGGVPVDGIFTKLPREAFEALGGSGIDFQLPTTSVTADPRGLMLVVGAESFTVRDFTHDGTGMSKLQLEAA